MAAPVCFCQGKAIGSACFTGMTTFRPNPVALVHEPAEGAIRLAMETKNPQVKTGGSGITTAATQTAASR
jgi:hypothetical protein